MRGYLPILRRAQVLSIDARWPAQPAEGGLGRIVWTSAQARRYRHAPVRPAIRHSAMQAGLQLSRGRRGGPRRGKTDESLICVVGPQQQEHLVFGRDAARQLAGVLAGDRTHVSAISVPLALLPIPQPPRRRIQVSWPGENGTTAAVWGDPSRCPGWVPDAFGSVRYEIQSLAGGRGMHMGGVRSAATHLRR